MTSPRLSSAPIVAPSSKFGEPTVVCVQGSDTVRIPFGSIVTAVLKGIPVQAGRDGKDGLPGVAGARGEKGDKGDQGEPGLPGSGADILVDADTFEVVIDTEDASVISDVEVAA